MANVSLLIDGSAQLSEGDGYYFKRLSVGSDHTLWAWADGYIEENIGGIDVLDGQTTAMDVYLLAETGDFDGDGLSNLDETSTSPTRETPTLTTTLCPTAGSSTTGLILLTTPTPRATLTSTAFQTSASIRTTAIRMTGTLIMI
jgi:hypothetical protein